MSAFFLKVANMSISASWLVLAVLLLRLVLKKAPKWANVLLWGLVGIRLLCPISLQSALSLIPSAETIPPEIMMDPNPRIHTGIQAINSAVNPVIQQSLAPDPGASANPLQILIPVAAAIWLAGVVALGLYTAISYWYLRRKLATAVRLEEGLYQSEYVSSPFVLGLVKPRIYLPYQLNPQALGHVLAHERCHIRRRDHWWKPLGFALLSLHWFNPLMWVGYCLLCRDIEMACDEKVIRQLGGEERAGYTQALVDCSIRHSRIAACPLAFGEVGVKARVRSVLHYKKPTFWILLVAVTACILAAVCFLTDPWEAGRPVGTTYYYGTVTQISREQLVLRLEDGSTVSFRTEEDISRELLGQYVMVRARALDGGQLLTTGADVTDPIRGNTPEEAIEKAILGFHRSDMYEGMLQCADFQVLSTEAGGPAATSTIDTVIFYGLALHQVYTLRDGALMEVGGSHCPTVLTFAVDDSGHYLLAEFWQPRDGSYYPQDIREKFPPLIWPDTQNYIARQEARNVAKAQAYYGLAVSDNAAWKPLEELLRGYTQEQARQDGCVVMDHSELVSGDSIWLDFVLRSRSGEAAQVRVYQGYSDQGDYVLKELTYDGQHYHLRYFDREAESGKDVQYQKHFGYLNRSLYAWNPRSSRISEYFLLADSPEADAEGYLGSLVSSVPRAEYEIYNHCHMILSFPADQDYAQRSLLDVAYGDIDGDGVPEKCCLGIGPTSGLFSFTFTAYQGGQVEHESVFISDFYDLSFRIGPEGKLVVQGIPQGEQQIHLFEIEMQDGYICLVDGDLLLAPMMLIKD